jgi:hypothetical protein
MCAGGEEREVRDELVNKIKKEPGAFVASPGFTACLFASDCAPSEMTHF